MINQAKIEHSGLVDNFIGLYQALNKDNLHLLAELYDDNICFIDPMHQVNGLNALTQYFAKLYQNIGYIHFEIKEVLQDDTQASLFWQMQYRHPKLNKGELVRVDGMSQLKFHQRIYFHRDYFDLGQMLYEHLPCMGGLIRLLKDRAAK
ncbi:MAG: nuclear transport factor 2 family protein [Shewanella sp.]|uniref:Nuclear transport factor 2 family protein n=1 Tax=Shewanella cutis TaxID=2766780 RepID=A0ABS9QYU1_9GAMM|nr:nuclear transport factor 2 family protein [Shewanella sp. PS-2]MCG9965542.1 nuclear transport factor 2 family protein [Shewanella sp. PS-2]